MITYELEGMILLGRNIDNKVYIPRLSLTYSDPRISFKFRQTQFPLIILFAMTINKSQENYFKYVGVYLTQSVFSHGQLYVVISRVTSRNNLKLLLATNESQDINTILNIVYKEVFQN